MKYYKRNPGDKDYKELDAGEKEVLENQLNVPPPSAQPFIQKEEPIIGDPYQGSTIVQEDNPAYTEQKSQYDAAQRYVATISFVAENSKELFQRLKDKIENIDTKRKDSREKIIKELSDTKSPQEFLDKFLEQYKKLLQSSVFAQPTIFGEGSKLAKEMREFAKDFLFIDLQSKLKNKQVQYNIIEPKLHEKVIPHPHPTPRND